MRPAKWVVAKSSGPVHHARWLGKAHANRKSRSLYQGRATILVAFSSQAGQLFLMDCIIWANLGARAAADASIGVNRIDVTLADSARWANTFTSSTCYTIVINNVCHFVVELKIYINS